jgi:hypothetical protein
MFKYRSNESAIGCVAFGAQPVPAHSHTLSATDEPHGKGTDSDRLYIRQEKLARQPRLTDMLVRVAHAKLCPPAQCECLPSTATKRTPHEPIGVRGCR